MQLLFSLILVTNEDDGVTTHFYVVDETVFLLSIYDKSDKENISDKEIEPLLKLIQ